MYAIYSMRKIVVLHKIANIFFRLLLLLLLLLLRQLPHVCKNTFVTNSVGRFWNTDTFNLCIQNETAMRLKPWSKSPRGIVILQPKAFAYVYLFLIFTKYQQTVCQNNGISFTWKTTVSEEMKKKHTFFCIQNCRMLCCLQQSNYNYCESLRKLTNWCSFFIHALIALYIQR